MISYLQTALAAACIAGILGAALFVDAWEDEPGWEALWREASWCEAPWCYEPEDCSF